LARDTPRIAAVSAEYAGSRFLGTPAPRLSWSVTADGPWLQHSYQVEDGHHAVEVRSSDSVFVPWPFSPLRSREQRAVRVRATSTDGRTTPWSDVLGVEAALLGSGDWDATFVSPRDQAAQSSDAPCAFLRREFSIDGPIRSARLYVSALGVYEPYLNGAVVGDAVLAPNWTSYRHRLRFETYDVTAQLREGRNVIGAIVGDGWYRGRLGFRIREGAITGGPRNIYGDQLAIVAQLEVNLEDGRAQRIVSDEYWRWAHGPILAAGLYDGEKYDARLELEGWAEPGYDDRMWSPVRPLVDPITSLVVPTDPPIRRIESKPVVAAHTSPSGKTILDFGQNLAGRVRIRVSGSRGDTVTIHHAEVLEQGELALDPLRTARAEDRYTLRGGGFETWEPRFTFHGFRYAQIDGWPGSVDPSDVVAVVLHTALERIGWFECSNEMLNRLHENAVWSMRGNFVGLPTDCPQRDERLGWTGDLQVFAPAGCFLYNLNGPLVSWLQDLAAEQEPSGSVPYIVPDINPQLGNPDPSSGVAGWSDAAVIVPWTLYRYYGDLRALEAQFASMQAWVDYLVDRSGWSFLWTGDFQFGDHLAPNVQAGESHTDPDLIATAYFAHSARLLASAANALRMSAEQRRYTGIASGVTAAFRRAFLSRDGVPVCDTQTACCLALEFDLLPNAAARKQTAERLVELVRSNEFHIGTGFLGTPLICHALSNAGYDDVAYRLLLQEGCPSWLYPVRQGATTIWERWDSLLPDGSLNDSWMTSFNHYALGAVASWLHQVVGGLKPLEPGHRRVLIRPRPGGGITSARIEHQTPYGRASTSWEATDGELRIGAVVPAGTSARVVLPGSQRGFDAPSGAHHWTVPWS
jgi:alpha-L-rhamnosidase